MGHNNFKTKIKANQEDMGTIGFGYRVLNKKNVQLSCFILTKNLQIKICMRYRDMD